MTKPASALRLLRWVVLVLALMALGRAAAQETHRLNLDETRATLTATETALRDKNIDDAGLQALRTQSDALASELQGAIAELTPRLADSAKRLDELTPKSGRPPPRRMSPPRTSRTRSRGTTASTPTCAPPAPCCWKPTTSARASARRGVNCSRKNVRSIVQRPQSAALGCGQRRTPGRRRGGPRSHRNWLGAIGERPLLAKIGMAAIVIALALAAAPLGWIARRFVYRDLGGKTPSRLRRAVAAAWTFVLFAVLPLAGLGVLAGALNSFDLSDPSMQGVIERCSRRRAC